MVQETWLLLLTWSFCVSAASAIAQCLLQSIVVRISINHQHIDWFNILNVYIVR